MVMTTVGGCTACQVPKVRKTTRDFDHFTIDVDGLYEIRGVDVAPASPTGSYDSSLDADGKPDEDYLGGVDSQSAALVEESDSELDAEGEDLDFGPGGFDGASGINGGDDGGNGSDESAGEEGGNNRDTGDEVAQEGAALGGTMARMPTVGWRRVGWRSVEWWSMSWSAFGTRTRSSAAATAAYPDRPMSG
jgi:hypothetical protein